MKIYEIRCKTALSKSRLEGLDYALNPYKGCAHGCKYCYSPSVLHVSPIDWGNWVGVKTNLPNLLAKELKEKDRGTIGVGTVTDPYQPIEKDRKITRYSLELILKAGWPVSIQTKSKLVLKDLDLFKRFSNIEVIITITTLDDFQRKILEPGASGIEMRISALKKLSEEGIHTKVFFGPAYPTTSMEETSQIVKTFVDAGAEELMVDKLNIKPGVQDKIKFALRDYPDLSSIFEKNTGEEYYKKLFDGLEKECKGKIKFTNCANSKYRQNRLHKQ
jgi:DNA repair photolyase